MHRALLKSALGGRVPGDCLAPAEDTCLLLHPAYPLQTLRLIKGPIPLICKLYFFFIIRH